MNQLLNTIEYLEKERNKHKIEGLRQLLINHETQVKLINIEKISRPDRGERWKYLKSLINDALLGSEMFLSRRGRSFTLGFPDGISPNGCNMSMINIKQPIQLIEWLVTGNILS